MLDVIALGIAAISILLSIWLFIKSRVKPVITKIDPEERSLDGALHELHERSKPSHGKVHIHDVEETLRRHLG